MRRLWVAIFALCASAAVKDPALIRRAITEPARYSVLTTLLVNGAERRDRDVGYRLKTELHVAPIPQDSKDVLLRLQLVGTELLVRGKHRSAEWEQRGSLWDRSGGSPWLLKLDEIGAVKSLLLPVDDSTHVKNYKRALASLFQFAADTILEPGPVERNETDISGVCDVLYEPAASGARKIKSACEHDARAGVSARRIARYTLDPTGALGALHAEEVVTLEQAVKIRSWHELTYLDNKPRSSSPPGLDQLKESELTLEGSPVDEEDKPIDLREAIEQYVSYLGDEEAGTGGDINSARALLSLLPSLSYADQSALERALNAAEAGPSARLVGLCRALGLVGTAAASRAATAFLRLDAREPLTALAHHYLSGLALSYAPHPDAVLHVLRLAERAKNEAVQDATFLAVAAAGAKTSERTTVRESITKSLTRCKTDTCRSARLLALGNLKAATADLLVSSAERDANIAGAALNALRHVPDVNPTHLRRIGKIATNVSLPLEVRALALELVVKKRAASEQAAAPLQVLELAMALHSERGATAHELRRVLWQRLDALKESPPVRALLSLLPKKLTTWDARAHAGTSHVLTRSLGWAGGAGGWRAALDSAQVARSGVLRRGAVTLIAQEPRSRDQFNELEVEVWTRGLHSLTGGAEDDDPEEEMAGGLALSVGGARLPDVTLFSGQAELLGHVWSGTGSSPTGVVRGARLARHSGGALPLWAGVWARARTRAAVALALDAHATVSLWQRTARAGLALRGGVVALTETAVSVPWADVSAHRSFTAEPRLRIALDLDFYSGMALCVRAMEPAHQTNEHLKLSGVTGDRNLNVTRGAQWRRAIAGRTLALGRDNDVACRTLRAADDDDE